MRRLGVAAAPAMRPPRWDLFLFFAVETVAIATMVGLLEVSRQLACQEFLGLCTTPSGEGLVLGIATVLGELALLRVVLRLERPAWGAMLMFGLVSLFAFLVLLKAMPWLTSMFLPPAFARLLSIWHLVVAVLLMGAGLLGATREIRARRGHVVGSPGRTSP